MAVDEAGRHRLYEAARRALGDEEAAALMEYLPPTGWADVATKHDLVGLEARIDGLRAEMRADLAELRGEMRADLAELRGETRTGLAALRGEMTSEFAAVRGEIGLLRGEVTTEIAALRIEMGELRAEVYRAIHDSTVRIITFIIPTVLTGMAISVAVARLG